MHTKSVLVVVSLLFSTLAIAQQKRVYLDPNDQFSPYFTAALQKKKVPVIVTTDTANADYSVKFQANNSNGSLVQGVISTMSTGFYNSGAFNEVSMSVVDAKSKDVTFSYTCKKHDSYTGENSRRATSVAECLAKHWKDKLQ